MCRAPTEPDVREPNRADHVTDKLSVRLLRAFRWAHSFALEGHPVGAHGEIGAGVRATCEDTPPELPFIVHAAEGVRSEERRVGKECA